MTDTGPRQGISSQPPLIQLIFTFVIVVLAGTILFYIFLFIGSLISGKGYKELATLYSSGGEYASGVILRYIQVSVQVSLFLIPAIFIIRMLRKPGIPFLRMNIRPDLQGIILTIVLAFIILPSVPGNLCHISSVINGMNGWRSLKIPDNSFLSVLLTE